MSASSKKKLRREQEAEKLTEQQLTAQKEAKKLNLYTSVFVITLVVLLVIAVTVGVAQSIANSGIRERKTVAMTINDRSLSNADLSYFYMDAVNQFHSQYGSYSMMMGLDPSKPLDEQVLDEDTGKTWADDFVDSAKATAQLTYALYDAAMAEGFTLSQDQEQALTDSFSNMDAYAKLYGYPDAETYLKAIYGKGATMESFQEYSRVTTIANAYYAAHGESLSYTEADYRAVDKEKPETYSSFSFISYYLPTSSFLTGGTKAEDGTMTYSEEEKAAAEKAVEEAAKALTAAGTTTAEQLKADVAALDANKVKEITPSENTDTLYTSISTLYSGWLADSSRQEGDVACFASSTTDSEGKETVNGYHVVYFIGANDNNFPLVNVRHILLPFEGGATDPDTGAKVYTDAEKAAAKKSAEETLKTWQDGEATEESFAQLANEKSSDGDGTTGGLYENVYPGQMVQAFNDWCFDSRRQPGNVGIVETQYGYHVMYFSGYSDLTYRNSMIENQLRSQDLTAWRDEVSQSATVTDGDIKYLMTDLVLG